jgi:hypothetical protein
MLSVTCLQDCTCSCHCCKQGLAMACLLWHACKMELLAAMAAAFFLFLVHLVPSQLGYGIWFGLLLYSGPFSLLSQRWNTLLGQMCTETYWKHGGRSAMLLFMLHCLKLFCFKVFCCFHIGFPDASGSLGGNNRTLRWLRPVDFEILMRTPDFLGSVWGVCLR